MAGQRRTTKAPTSRRLSTCLASIWLKPAGTDWRTLLITPQPATNGRITQAKKIALGNKTTPITNSSLRLVDRPKNINISTSPDNKPVGMVKDHTADCFRHGGGEEV
jgi:hypothetical protein